MGRVKEENELIKIFGKKLVNESFASDEGISSGLGLLKGHVHKLPADQGERIPHMGWEKLDIVNNCPLLDPEDKSNWMYFVHSYSAIPNEKTELAATAKFGKKHVTAIVWKGRLGACQFHPEKSSKAGNQMLCRWVKWLDDGAQILS